MSDYKQYQEILCVIDGCHGRSPMPMTSMIHLLSENGYNATTLPFHIVDRFEHLGTMAHIPKTMSHSERESIESMILDYDLIWIINSPDHPILPTYVQDIIKFATDNEVPVKYLHIPNKSPVITICGSRKFRDEIMECSMKFRKEGNIVFTPDFDCVADPGNLTPEEIKIRHRVHYQKMEMSSVIYIYNKDGYIGTDTAREIEYAKLRGYNIVYLSDLNSQGGIINGNQ